MSAYSKSQTRKRGRPSGKNRVPLTAEQRRARNAQYERERREEMADALADLTDAAGCSENVTNGRLLQVVTNIIRKSKKSYKHRTRDQLILQNLKIMDEIAVLEEQLSIGQIEDWLHLPEGSPPRVATEEED